MRIEVACYAGYRGEETPRRLILDRREVEVVDVIDRWHGADHRYFKVEGSDGAVYIIRQDIPSQSWELTMFQRP
jgi:hypothetical protein